MATGLAITVIVLILLTTWFLGAWNNLITLVNTLFAAILASNFFEPLADLIDGGESSYTYLLDFVLVWVLFFASYAILRTATDLLSRFQLKFNVWLDRGLTTLFSMGTAGVFVCFMMFTFHMAPFPPGANDFQGQPNTVNFAGEPDKKWMSFLEYGSRGSMASAIDALLMPTYDADLLSGQDRELGIRVFDPKGDFVRKYFHRRQVLAEQESLRVKR